MPKKWPTSNCNSSPASSSRLYFHTHSVEQSREPLECGGSAAAFPHATSPPKRSRQPRIPAPEVRHAPRQYRVPTVNQSRSPPPCKLRRDLSGLLHLRHGSPYKDNTWCHTIFGFVFWTPVIRSYSASQSRKIFSVVI